jgi:methionyl-tRNA formyltransferase
MKIVFMGTPEFAVPVLEALGMKPMKSLAVYTQPPRPAGRGKADRPSPVQARAEALGLPVRHPVSLRSEVQRKTSLRCSRTWPSWWPMG